jgi:hypothetical protein
MVLRDKLEKPMSRPVARAVGIAFFLRSCRRVGELLNEDFLIRVR